MIDDLTLQTVVPERQATAAEFFIPSQDWGRERWQATGARGHTVDFADGVSAIDGISGLWNVSLGYGNPAVAQAIYDASIDASALPLFRRGSTYASRAAERLLDFYAGSTPTTVRPSAVLFATSGSSAIDATLKISRHWQLLQGRSRSRKSLSFSGSYHGMTLGAMGVTGEEIGQRQYGVEVRQHLNTPPDDPGAVDRLMERHGTELACVVVEPLLGSGAIDVPIEVIERLGWWRDRLGFLLVADEVATGFYRTGPRFASATWSAPPDLVVASKALTNGTCAASAVLIGDRVADAMAGSETALCHGETQAGAPQSCAAIQATIDEFERLDVAGSSAAVATRLDELLTSVAQQIESFGVRGRGCFRGLCIQGSDGQPISGDTVDRILERCREAGVLVQPGPSVVQFVPALTMDLSTVDQVVQRAVSVIGEELRL